MNQLSDDLPLDSVAPSQSNYLKKEDVTQAGVILTIKGLTAETLQDDKGHDEVKHIVHWVEDMKPMVLNQTNRELIKHFTGANTVGELKGKKVTVYNDPSVMFGGQMRGGIRVKGAPEPEAASKPNDEIPF